MAGVIKAVEWEESVEELHEIYRVHSDVNQRKRVQAMWLLRAGMSAGETARIVGIGRRTLTRWLAWYRTGGLKELGKRVPGHAAPGNAARLSEEQLEELVAHTKTGALSTYEDARQWVRSEYGVEYSYQGMYSVACEGRCASEGAASTSRQSRRRSAGGVEKGGLGVALADAGVDAEDRVLFSDEMRLGLRGQVRRVLAPRGVKVVQPVQLEYKWSYLFLAVEPLTGTLKWEWLQRMNKDQIKPVLDDWGLDVVVWDGAPAHKAKLMQQLSAKRLFLPPYSPELNPAERVFEEVRAHVEGEVYESLAAKQAQVERFLRELQADPERVKRLCGWDWIAAALQSLPLSRAVM